MPEVNGQVRLANGLAASGLTFQLYREVFGGDPVLVSEVTTDEQGHYAVDAAGIDERTSLVAKVPGQEDSWLAPLGARQDSASLHFIAPATAVATSSEYARLRDALAPVLGDVRLGDAVEDDARSDITVAHRETGWDARLIAVSAMAERLDLGMGPDATYALLRAGLPSDPDLLSRVPSATVKAVLAKAVDSGIVDLSGGRPRPPSARSRTSPPIADWTPDPAAASPACARCSTRVACPTSRKVPAPGCRRPSSTTARPTSCGTG